MVVWLSKREQLGVDGKPVGAMLTEFQVALKDYLYKDCNTFVEEVDAAKRKFDVSGSMADYQNYMKLKRATA